ncbi:hypothetical protein [Amycolatopsis sp. cmx-4-54]|uniref:SPW repeat domain-containing protein n=1 Tax=Amycolatopsis sp. cmx-4-54 TaxID=2790936 RepID=UPI00397A8DCF
MKASSTEHQEAPSEELPPSLTHEVKFTVIDALTSLAGLWLLFSLFLLDHANTGPGFNGYWSDGLSGAVLLLLGAISIVDPPKGISLGLLRLILGGWLITAPNALGYHLHAPAPQAATSDTSIGLVVLALWVFRRHPE